MSGEKKLNKSRNGNGQRTIKVETRDSHKYFNQIGQTAQKERFAFFAVDGVDNGIGILSLDGGWQAASEPRKSATRMFAARTANGARQR